MSLNLGLESLGIVTDDVSLESVLQAEITLSDAQISFERACFQVATEARNIHNFNEIIDSLQRHSSQECVAFAQDLLGTASLEKIDVPGTPAAKTIGERAKGVWTAFWEFVKKCGAFIKKWTGKLLAKIHLMAGQGFEGKIKVSYSGDDLDKFTGAVDAQGNLDAVAGSKLESILKLDFLVKKPKKTELDLANAEAYLGKLQKAQMALVHLFTWTKSRTGSAITWTANDKGEKVGTGNLVLTTWLTHMLRRLKPFQKGIMSDFTSLMNRYRVTATSAVSAVHGFSKKTKDGETRSAKKIGSAFGGTKDVEAQA